MRILQNLGAGVTLVGVLLVMAGGMTVRGGPAGTWIQVNVVHMMGGVGIVFGTVLSVIAASKGKWNTTVSNKR